MLELSFAKALFASALIIFTLNTPLIAQDTLKKTTAKPKVIAKPVIAKPGATYPAKPYQTKPYQAKPAATIPKAAASSPAVTATATNTYSTPVVQPAPTDRSINGQYQYLLTKLYGYQRPMAAAFYKSITDSLHNVQKKIKPLEANVATLQDTVKDLHKQLASQQTEINDSSAKVDSISLLGINMTKAAYNMLMWGLVVAFGVIAAIVITRSGSYSREAKHRTQLYDELEEEHKNYKAKANEKEKKLARELQTARNKLEDLTGKPDY